ncbi:hypothetical protein QZH41_016568, partial [Actinostola sp. cb2023]
MDLPINHGQMAERVQTGRSPPPRRRRTREYVPNAQRSTKQDLNNLDAKSIERALGSTVDENMNTVPHRQRSDSHRSEQLGERFHILKAENKILRERLQNALQREMKALKTFKRLAKENRQLKLNLRKYERTLLGFYEDESDSDPNEVSRENELQAFSKRLAVPPVKSKRSNSADSDISGLNTDEEARVSPSLAKTRSASTSMEDISIPVVEKQDKSTSTHDLVWNGRKSRNNSQSNYDEICDLQADHNFVLRKDSSSSVDNENNLTDSTKVRLLHQLVDMQSQPVTERRKFSDSRRYWSDSSGLDNTLEVNQLCRTSSSPGVLGSCCCKSYGGGEGSGNKEVGSGNKRKGRTIQVEEPDNFWIRAAVRSPPTDFTPRPFRHSFNEDELETVPEINISPDGYHDDADSQESYEYESPTSPDDILLSNQSPIPPYSNDDVSQTSPRSSPPPLTVDVPIDPIGDVSNHDNIHTPRDNSQRRPTFTIFHRTEPAKGTLNNRRLRRPGLGHTVSLPAASFDHYLSVFHGDGGSRSDTHDIIEEDVEEEGEEDVEKDAIPPAVLRRGRRRSVDDDEVYVKKNREKRLKKTSVSLRFDGDMPREDAEILAKDIAAYLEYRKQCSADSSDAHTCSSMGSFQLTVFCTFRESAAIARARSLSRRRGSAVVTLPGERSYQMDLHVFNKQAERLESKSLLHEKTLLQEKRDLSGSSTSLNSIGDPEKRSRWSILKRNKKLSTYAKDTRRQTGDFKEALSHLRENPKETIEHELAQYKDNHWTQLIPSPQEPNQRPLSDGFSNLTSHETKRREALWEIFHSEVVYLIDHLLVLSEVFLEPLELLQQMGHLNSVHKSKIFCNVKGLCEVSAKFAEDLLLVFKGDQSKQFGNTAAVVTAFTEFGCKLQPQYQEYCLNYSIILGYLDQCKKSDDFQEYIKLCEADPRCNRLQLTDLLVAPLQHLTKYPLLLKNIRERTTEGEDEHSSLSSVIKSVELSIKELEGKVKSLANFERLQELQNCLVWPSIIELDPKTYVPEFLRGILAKQPCESLLASPKRQLLYEGSLVLLENTKQDIYAFLFDDMLLLTRYRKYQQKTNKKLSLAGMTDSPPPTPPVVRKLTPIGQYIVYKQPIPLDRFIVIDAEATHAGNTLKNSFIVIHYSRFKQTIGLYTLQAPSQNLKETWTSTLKAAQSSWSEAVAMEIATEAQKVIPTSLPSQSSTELPSEEPG